MITTTTTVTIKLSKHRLTFREEPVVHPKEEHFKMETPQFTQQGHPKHGILYNSLHRSYSASRAAELQQSAP